MSMSNYIAVAVMAGAATFYAPRYFQKEGFGNAELVAKRGEASIYEIERGGKRYLFNTNGGLVEVVEDGPQESSSREIAGPNGNGVELPPTVAIATPPAADGPSPECLSSGGDPKAAKEAAAAAARKEAAKNSRLLEGERKPSVPLIMSENDYLPLFPRPDLANNNRPREAVNQDAPLPTP